MCSLMLLEDSGSVDSRKLESSQLSLLTSVNASEDSQHQLAMVCSIY